MNKGLIWTIVVAVLVILAVVMVSINKGGDDVSTGGETELPGTNQAEYANLATSTADFAALDEAANQLG